MGAYVMLLTASSVAPVEIHQKTLDNGLQVIVVPEHSAPVAAVQVWYKVGSRNESYDITGIAHMLEHMMFKGSANVKGRYSEIIDQLGGSDNAFTSQDMTVYHCVVPSDVVDVPLRLEADRMHNLLFQEFPSERDVVMEERRWRTENSPFGTAWENLWATAFFVHPYHHPVIGWRSAIEHFTVDKLRKFYETYYVPNNAILVVAGDVEPDSIFALAQKFFGQIPRSPVDPPEVISVEPPQQGERRTVVHKEGFMTIVFTAYHIPAAGSEDMPALDVLGTVLGGGKSSRLYKSLVKQKELATDVWAYADEGVDPGLFVVGAILQQGKDPKDVEDAINAEIAKLTEGGVSQEELHKASTQAMADYVFQRESASGLAFSVGNAVLLHHDPDYVNRYPDLVAKVKPEDVLDAARTYLIPDNRTVVLLLPKAPEDIEAYMKMMQEGQKKEFKY